VSAPPGEVEASSTDDVTLECVATTDARRSSHLLITWYHDGLPVSDEDGGRVRMTDAGTRLVIERSAVSDSGVYRCSASNGVDQDSASVTVTIKGLSACLPALLTAQRSDVCLVEKLPSLNNVHLHSLITTHDKCFKVVFAVFVRYFSPSI